MLQKKFHLVMGKKDIVGDPTTWVGANAMAREYLPHEGITYEQRYGSHMERMLLAVLFMDAHRSGQLNFSYIYKMAKKLDAEPRKTSEMIRHTELPEASQALDQVLRCVGSLFCEPTKQLLLSLERQYNMR